ncbi:MAG: carboxymuconolactone decarboxylase family protein [Bacteroidota bacterium]|nr:carboxymuconolactone decarboxylase family protein [Bacteroidota bacterium]
MSLVETKNDLLRDLGIDSGYTSTALEKLVNADSKYLKDLRINLNNVLSSINMTKKESLLIALAIAVNERNEILKSAFTALAAANDATNAEIAEAVACASLLATNNVFYRFKHFIGGSTDEYQNMPAGIKMNIMINPILGKELFELISLAVSAVNGCEQCVNSHEASVKTAGASAAKIFDAIRLAAVIRGLSIIIN